MSGVHGSILRNAKSINGVFGGILRRGRWDVSLAMGRIPCHGGITQTDSIATNEDRLNTYGGEIQLPQLWPVPTPSIDLSRPFFRPSSNPHPSNHPIVSIFSSNSHTPPPHSYTTPPFPICKPSLTPPNTINDFSFSRPFTTFNQSDPTPTTYTHRLHSHTSHTLHLTKLGLFQLFLITLLFPKTVV